MTPQQKYYLKNRAKHRQWADEWRFKNYNKTLYNSARQRAARSNLEFSLKLEDIVIPDICPVLGIKIIPYGNRQQGHGASIDRRDNSKGYTKDNITVCSLRANMLKNNGTKEEFLKIIAYIDNCVT